MKIKKHVLVVTLANTWRTRMALYHEGEAFPYSFRTIQIPLTDEQNRMIAGRMVGREGSADGPKDVFEELYNSHLEVVDESPPGEKSTEST